MSIVIPVFNESRKVAQDIKEAESFLISNHLEGEIIVVDDGSKDNTAIVAEKTEIRPEIILKVKRYKLHHGKGYAVRTGMNISRGDYVMFADSGSCVPYENTLHGLNLIQNGECDIAHGSRKLQASSIQSRQNWYRRCCSRFFRWVMTYGMRIPCELTDTQCGFKIYRGDVARRLYGQCVIDGFSFDVEIILRSQKQGYRIKEFPIEWVCDPDSRTSPVRNSWRILRELITIKRILSG